MTEPGAHMKSELAEAPAVFANTVKNAVSGPVAAQLAHLNPHAIYTIARGSSDAAANILSYEFMRELGKPMTSLPPSIFSVGRGVDMSDTLALVVSQSGGSNDLVLSAKGARESGMPPMPARPAARAGRRGNENEDLAEPYAQGGRSGTTRVLDRGLGDGAAACGCVRRSGGDGSSRRAGLVDTIGRAADELLDLRQRPL